MQKNTEYAMFFDSDAQNDRLYSSDDLRDFFSKFFASGILGNKTTGALQVLHTAGLNVKVTAGTCLVNGAIRNFADTTLTLSYGDNEYNRIDSVVLRYDETARNINLLIIEGTPALNPVPPEIVRNENVFDLVIAHIQVQRAATEITQSAISDKRGQAEYAPYVYCVLENINTSKLFVQYEDAWARFVSSLGTKNITINTTDRTCRNMVRKLRVVQPFTNYFKLI